MNNKSPFIIGWREWAALPELGITRVKFKTDTGAKTSALHAVEMELLTRNGQPWVQFITHPDQNSNQQELICQAPLVDERVVTDSGGHGELRPVIQTRLVLGCHAWPIEITLTARCDMRFRMLLGRNAMLNHCIVDPNASYLHPL